MRTNQSSFIPWGKPLEADGFLREIKPSHSIASVNIMNVGNTEVYLWTDVKIEVGSSLQLAADQTAYLSLSKVSVHFETSGVTSPAPKLVVLAERVTPIRNNS